MTRLTTTLGAFTLLSIGATACDSKSLAYGDVNSVIAVMSPQLWSKVEDDVYAALEPTIRTVRAEKTFTVTYQQPFAEFWSNMRRFRQILIVGSATDSIVVEALGRANEEISQPGVHQLGDVWARGQSITLVLLPEGGGSDDLLPHLAAVNTLLDGQYRLWARNRMYLSGVDSALADTLHIEAGFVLLLPQVYKWSSSDSVFVFRNDNPDPAELIRQIAVTWWTPIPADLQAEGILAWREQLVAAYYSEPQVNTLNNVQAGPMEYRGRPAYQIHGEWTNPPDRGWPAGGPFITRAVVCENQNRMYLIDSWLYAPGKEKYEYMIQLETILDSFRCGAA
jgi:hypothetical protein